MYCRYCGKLVEDDSTFCKYCGNNLVGEFIVKKESENFIAKFNSLSESKQKFILFFALWVLLVLWTLLHYCELEHWDRYDGIPFSVTTLLIFVLPYIGFIIYYFVKLRKNKKQFKNNISIEKDKSDIELEQEKVIVSETVKLERVLVKSYLLLDFARINGKMQMVKDDKENGEIENYCIFTSSDGNIKRVNFSTKISTFTVKDISEHKYNLCVNEYTDGVFELDFC
jgi:RNA polymerase subunit RPABC4/transcription elongation factor Spt4